MKLGVIFPQTEIGRDPGAIREYAQAAEASGYNHLAVYDHVLGADASKRPGWSGAYNKEHLFHEPMVLFGYLAAITTRLELVTMVLILPQRQTALVAKQAAEVDVLSGGRLRLGVGLGWNDVEYEALGENFHNRGARSEEQIAVMRALWTQEVVDFHGRWHNISEAGINPMPVQRPIPVWFGGGRVDKAIRRIARIGDGWFPMSRPDATLRQMIEQVQTYAKEAGRDPAAISIEARLTLQGTPEDWASEYKAWQEMGVSHVSINTMRCGFNTPAEHIAAIRNFKETIAP